MQFLIQFQGGKGHTQELSAFQRLQEWDPDDDCGACTMNELIPRRIHCSLGHVHASNAKYNGYTSLRPDTSPQSPDQERRQQTYREITRRSDSTVEVDDVCEDINVNTTPIGGSALPVVVDGTTLEYREEEKDDPDDKGQYRDGPKDDLIYSFQCEAEEEDDDGLSHRRCC
jgi:hypothetical protein